MPQNTPHSDHTFSEETQNLNSGEIFAAARALAQEQSLPFAGSLNPEVAWLLHKRGEAKIIDVRTAEELKFVGQVPDTGHVAWQTGAALIKNPRFIKELENKAKHEDVILFLCRSGKRSAAAAESATKAGFINVFNIHEGFEGDLDENQRRGEAGGWRRRGLPWIQN